MTTEMQGNGFVAGTLVHTKTGLKPIEQIQVGDYVLSKPETGEGEPSYKRVVNTFTFDDKEVVYVKHHIEKMNERGCWDKSENAFFITTINHPIRVKSYRVSDKDHEVNVWESVRNFDINDFYSYTGGNAKLELYDGRLANVDHFNVGDVLDSDAPNVGIIAVHRVISGESDASLAVIFNHDTLEITEEDFGYFYDYQPPLLRTVYNLEVEDNHTYYVGELGVLVGTKGLSLTLDKSAYITNGDNTPSYLRPK
jgi:hypothetical protein